MKAADVLTVALVAAGAYAAFRIVRAGQNAAGVVGGWIDDAGAAIADGAAALIAAPGRAVSALVSGTSVLSDPDAGGFLRTSDGWSGFVPDYSANRDVRPLVEYFRRWGNTAASRAQATAAGWSQNEISVAVAAMNFEG